MTARIDPNRTSARLMFDVAAETVGKSDDPAARRQMLMIADLYIKARSFAILNKIAFVWALGCAILIALWPAVAVLAEGFSTGARALTSAAVQTSVTALAALGYAVYGHYKKRQQAVENLMRRILATEPGAMDLERVLGELERIDQGFAFPDPARRAAAQTPSPASGDRD
jgi:hypothetical protein